MCGSLSATEAPLTLLVRAKGAQEVEFAERWHGAVRDWQDLQLAWGLLDPVANTEVLGALRELHPGVPVTEMPDLGHYPQLEDPQRMAAIVADAVAKGG